MKKILLFATAVAAIASCSDQEFVGGKEVVDNSTGAISFTSNSNAVTRALTGAAAAEKLNNNFVVEGIKYIPGDNNSETKVEVFDNYNVNYVENTANTTASNSANWEYVAQDILTGKTSVAEQTIKYWDFAASKYDFWAYSLGSGSATVSPLAHDAELNGTAYTVKGAKADLAKVYISDLMTCYPVGSSYEVGGNTITPPHMGDEVSLTFRSMMTKVRVGLYETIPGYSVRNVKFYTSASDNSPGDAATLFANSAVLPDAGTNDVTCIVQFSHYGQTSLGTSDYNRAHVFLQSGNTTDKVQFGGLSYGAHQDGKHEKTGFTEGSGDNSDTWTEIWVQRSANTVTWAKETSANAGDYSIVLPYETGAVLTLKVDYTLESIDGTGETITVHGATALIPSQFAQWKSGYAYTYLFKISDNTNGLTNPSVPSKTGLYPITLDAVVEGGTDGTQETITTVATPSITTYSLTSDVYTNDEYTTSDDIYVTVTEDGTLINMVESNVAKAALYDITKSSAAYKATEAEVLETLTKYTSLTSNVYTGRNSIVLTPAKKESNNILDLTQTSIPLIDGSTATVTAGQVGYIAKNKLTAGHYYAFVYKTADGTINENNYEAINTTGITDVKGYYTENNGTYTEITETTSPASGITYYAKYTTSTSTYAIKVIKINTN